MFGNQGESCLKQNFNIKIVQVLLYLRRTWQLAENVNMNGNYINPKNKAGLSRF